MSGATAATYIMGGLAAASTIATVDAQNSARHQARLQQEAQARQIEEANAIAAQEREMTERINRQNLEAQRSAQAASLAAAEKQSAESRALMDKQLKAAEEATNRAAQKRPNTSSILSEAEQAGRSGVSGTMLTGPQGVSNDQLTLGRSTLLGA